MIIIKPSPAISLSRRIYWSAYMYYLSRPSLISSLRVRVPSDPRRSTLYQNSDLEDLRITFPLSDIWSGFIIISIDIHVKLLGLPICWLTPANDEQPLFELLPYLYFERQEPDNVRISGNLRVAPFLRGCIFLLVNKMLCSTLEFPPFWAWFKLIVGTLPQFCI